MVHHCLKTKVHAASTQLVLSYVELDKASNGTELKINSGAYNMILTPVFDKLLSC